MANIHTPERQPGESMQDYRLRRDASKAAVKWVTKGPTQAPHIQIPGGPLPNWVHFWTGQHTNPGKEPSRRDLHRLASKTFVHQPKPAKTRKHKQHQHPLRDEHGAYTLTGFRGMLPEVVGQDGVTGEFVIEMRYFSARKWLAGISAQRGY